MFGVDTLATLQLQPGGLGGSRPWTRLPTNLFYQLHFITSDRLPDKRQKIKEGLVAKCTN